LSAEADRIAVLASYGSQANDQILVHMALKIRAPAIRKAGKLLRQIKPAKNQYDELAGRIHVLLAASW
jgi:hypothetical protein